MDESIYALINQSVNQSVGIMVTKMSARGNGMRLTPRLTPRVRGCGIVCTARFANLLDDGREFAGVRVLVRRACINLAHAMLFIFCGVLCGRQVVVVMWW